MLIFDDESLGSSQRTVTLVMDANESLTVTEALNQR